MSVAAKYDNRTDIARDTVETDNILIHYSVRRFCLLDLDVDNQSRFIREEAQLQAQSYQC